MSRKRPRGENPVSLFPFLSVLSCIIGTLTLMITALALGEVINAPEKKNAEGKKLVDRKTIVLEELTGISEKVDAIERKTAAYEAAREELKALDEAYEEAARRHEDALENLRVSDELRVRAHSTSREIDRMNSQIDEARKQLDKQLEAERSHRIRLHPGGTGKNLRPRFVECTDTSLRLYSGFNHISIPVDQEDIPASPIYKSFLSRLGLSRHDSIIFLVRPNGIKTHKVAASVAKEMEVKYGKLPLPGDGEIDFSLFDQATKQ